MNKFFQLSRLYHGLFIGFGVLFVAAMAGGEIAYSNESALNSALKINTTAKKGEGSNYYSTTYTTEADVKDYVKKTAIEVEEEGLVLLKNDNEALPLASQGKVSLFGTASYRFNYNTSGSSSTSSSGYETFIDALTNAKFSVNPTLQNLYETGAGKDYGRTTNGNTYLINEMPFSNITADMIGDYSEAAIVTLARDSGEGKDLTTNKSDGEDGSYLSLSQDELDLLSGLTTFKKQGKIKKIIVLLNTSNPIEQDYLFREGIDVDSVLWVGNVGAYGVEGVVNVLSGEANPSGKLSDTYCRDDFSSPAMASWSLNRAKSVSQLYSNYQELELNSTQRSYEIYNEGVYIGYRYYETRYEDYCLGKGNAGDYSYSNDVAFPFGYGLSYTSFEFSNYKVTPSSDGKSFAVSVDVKNTGKKNGKEVVEIYLQKEYTSYDQDASHPVEKPSVELVAYGKTKDLAPDETETINVKVNKSQFKSYDSYGCQTYILEDCDYLLALGSDSHNAINNILDYKNCAKADAKGDASFVYKYHNDEFDKTTYSVSEETGETITNQFDHADMNRYSGKGDNSVKYITRNDWTGSWPVAPQVFTITTDEMKNDISSDHQIVEETGAEMPLYGQESELNVASLMGLPYDDEHWDELLNSMTYEEQANLITSGQLSTITLSSIGLPSTKDLDGPTAVTETKTASSFPSEGIWASSYNEELITKVGDAFGEDICLCDTEGIYAPGVNLHRTPFIGRTNEYFSEDPFLTGRCATTEIIALQDKGIVAHLKHFAFNECETNRNGICVWFNEQEARELLLEPFEMCVRDADVGSIMSSFNRDGCLWLGADSNAQVNVLRKEWGFKGYIITDMAVSNGASYMVYSDGFMNGTDLFLGSGSSSALDAYKSSATFALKMREASHHILYTICNKSRAMNGLTASSVVQTITPWWKNVILGLRIGAGVIAGVSLVLTLIPMFVKKEN